MWPTMCFRSPADDGPHRARRCCWRSRRQRRLPASRALIRTIQRRFPELIELYDNTASLQDRTATTGILKTDLVPLWWRGGYIGRASGRAFDARQAPGYAPYTALTFDVAVRQQGDVDARIWVRINEVRQSTSID